MEIPSQAVTFIESCGLHSDRADAVFQAMKIVRNNLTESSHQFNLSRLTNQVDFWIKHVADSLSLFCVMPDLLQGKRRLADIGPGAGFPLLVLAAANPELICWGIEPVRKKTDFINNQIECLGLTNCGTVSVPAKEASHRPEFRNSMDLVVARAVGQSEKLIREARLLLEKGGGSAMLLYKTPRQIEQEYDVLKRETKKYGLILSFSDVFELPLNAGKRQFVIAAQKTRIT